MLVAQGHRWFKGKVRGLSLAKDIAPMEIVRDVTGPDRDLMIDVNRATPGVPQPSKLGI